MKLKQLFKNPLVFILLAIILFCLFSYSDFNNLLNIKEGLENHNNNCPAGCKISTSIDGNCKKDSSGKEICPMYCSNTDLDNSNACQYDTDCKNCEESEITGNNGIENESPADIAKQCRYFKKNPSALKKMPLKIQNNYVKYCHHDHHHDHHHHDHHHHDHHHNNKKNWSKIGSNIGYIIGDHLTDSTKHHRHHHNHNNNNSNENNKNILNQWGSDLKNDWKDILSGNSEY